MQSRVHRLLWFERVVIVSSSSSSYELLFFCPLFYLSAQFHTVRHVGAFREEVHSHPLRRGCWEENTQIFYCILTDLVNRLGSVDDEDLTGDPDVFSQFHCVCLTLCQDMICCYQLAQDHLELVSKLSYVFVFQ